MNAIIVSILIQICMYSILAIALNLLIGYVGLFSVATAALFGIGAYITGLVLLKFNVDIIIAIVIAATFTSLVGTLIAIPSLRLKGDYFYITTLGFQWIVFNIMMNWMEVTNGPLGLYGIPTARIFGIPLNTQFRLATFVLIIFGICIFFAYHLCSSPYGRALKGVREDEVAMEALGKNVTRFKFNVFAFSAVLCSIAGAIYVCNMQAVDPTAFTMDESIFILCMVVLGGKGRLKGSIVGAILLVIISEGLRYVGIPIDIAFQARQIIYGVTLVLCMMFRPQGLFGEIQIN